MVKTMVGLVPLIIAAAVLPTGIVMTLFWLGNRCGLSKAVGFAAGRLFAQLLQGVLVGYALKEADQLAGTRAADLVPSALLLIVGVLCVSAALVTSLRKPRPAAAAAPARWVAALRRVSAPAVVHILMCRLNPSMASGSRQFQSHCVGSTSPLSARATGCPM